MALVVADADAAAEILRRAGETVFPIGRVATGEGAASVRIDPPPGWLA
ncbi:MAG: hypothetical protein JO118_14905 [Acetobacteraceae bacterium]|nr:hypothetical protein [Acetobacteraceae bacterium]